MSHPQSKVIRRQDHCLDLFGILKELGIKLRAPGYKVSGLSMSSVYPAILRTIRSALFCLFMHRSLKFSPYPI